MSGGGTLFEHKGKEISSLLLQPLTLLNTLIIESFWGLKNQINGRGVVVVFSVELVCSFVCIDNGIFLETLDVL